MGLDSCAWIDAAMLLFFVVPGMMPQGARAMRNRQQPVLLYIHVATGGACQAREHSYREVLSIQRWFAPLSDDQSVDTVGPAGGSIMIVAGLSVGEGVGR